MSYNIAGIDVHKKVLVVMVAEVTEQGECMSDGGEDVRRVQEYLQPHSEHLIDWFHIKMRVTVCNRRPKPCRRSGLKPALTYPSV